MVELRVSVPNRPGVVADVALALGRASVNIVDMALYPAADNTTGSIALWIAGDDDAREAEGLIDGARLHGGAAVTFFAPAAAGLRGTLAAPPDKSISHRAALLAAMTSDPVQVTGYLDAEDTRSTLRAVQALGAIVEPRADESC